MYLIYLTILRQRYYFGAIVRCTQDKRTSFIFMNILKGAQNKINGSHLIIFGTNLNLIF